MNFIECELLRVFVGEKDKLHHRPIYELLVSEALDRGMAGDLPMVVEIVDTTEKIEAFLPFLETLLREAGAEALVTRENVKQWTT